jgi:bifunctional DNA-binding transcriptional regulator/antitoxin component of YhaV-PrlF toxin-antitoxin module
MSFTAKVEQHGDDLFISLPEEALAHLKAKIGDSVELVRTPDGLLLKPYDTYFEEKMAALRHVMDEHSDVLRRLAE